LEIVGCAPRTLFKRVEPHNCGFIAPIVLTGVPVRPRTLPATGPSEAPAAALQRVPPVRIRGVRRRGCCGAGSEFDAQLHAILGADKVMRRGRVVFVGGQVFPDVATGWQPDGG